MAVACIVAFAAGQPEANGGTGVETILHSFNGNPVNGSHPQGNLVLSNDGLMVYGMTEDGGAAGLGVVYKVGVGGDGYAVLHAFGGAALDGASPNGSLTLSGTTLYGMTYSGGASNTGVVFKVNTDGTGYQVLHSLAGGATDGANPVGSLTLSGSVLYGMTSAGGANNDGTIFSINADGNGFVLLHSFAGAADGAAPYGSLTLSGTLLYGMTSLGGANGCGVIFLLDTGNNNTFGLLHTFTGGDGEAPLGSLTLLNGTTLYGMTEEGGDNGCGTVFGVGTNGTGFTTLRSFDWLSDGGFPVGDLSANGSTLYGTTSQGGASQHGTIFAIDVSGSPFSVVYALSSAPADGGNPKGGLTLAGGTIYGTSAFGGSNGNGALFGISPAGAGFALLYSFGDNANDGAQPQGSLTLSGTMLYGMTKSGGACGLGTVFTQGTDGTSYEVLHSFSGGAADGARPYGNLTPNGAILYGMTSQGGASNLGMIFTMKTDASGFAPLHTFAGGASDGASPYGSLTLSPDGMTLYGMTFGGGSYGLGTVFRMNVDGTGFSVLHSFTGGTNDGATPYGSLALAPTGLALYGMTYAGGAGSLGTASLGTVFTINTSGSGFALLHSFTGGSSDGANPQGGLTLVGATLMGMTSAGGINAAGTSGEGTIFKINADGTGFAMLYSFNASADGTTPLGDLTLGGTSTLYGMISSGSVNSEGSVFQMDASGSNFQVLYSFGGSADDGQSPAGDVLLSGTTLYGLTTQGGSGDAGTLFKFDLQAATIGYLTVTLSPSSAVNAGAQWSVDGGNTWNDSGQLVSLAPGNYTLTFSVLSGWISPASVPITIIANGWMSETGTYIQQPGPGSLQVTLAPAGAILADAQWSMDGGITWHNSGYTVSDLAPGGYTVTYSPITGWTSPANATVTLTAGTGTGVLGTYVQSVHTLTVQSSPLTAVVFCSTTGQGGKTNYTLNTIPYGATVDLSAPTANPPGYTFLQWTVGSVVYPARQKEVSFAMTSDTTAVAQYTPNTCTFNVQSQPIEGVTISSLMSGAAGTTNYPVSEPYGTTVSLSAPAADPAGYTFLQWTLNGTPQPAQQKTISFPVASAIGFQHSYNWGGNWGSGNGQFNSAQTLALDDAGNIYIMDCGNYRIQKFTSSGQFLTWWGGEGSGDGQFGFGGAVVCDSAGNVFVADVSNNRVQIFTSGGQYITQWGVAGSAVGQLQSPSAIAFDSTGNVYLTDAGNSRIQEFTSGGQYITSWGSSGHGNGQFNQPKGIALDSAGNVYVADTSNYRIQKFTSDGRYITQWGSQGTGNGQFSAPYYVTCDSANNVYVTDQSNGCVQVFTSGGQFLMQLGSEGSQASQFVWPEGIALDNAGNVVVLDCGINRVSVWSVTLQASAPVAVYQVSTNPLTVQSAPPTGLAIGSSTGDGGTTNYTVSGVVYGTSVTLQAPATDPTGYTFSQWTVNGAGQTLGQKAITFTVNASTTAVAQYALTAVQLQLPANQWQMVSLALNPTSATPFAVFGSGLVAVYAWDSVNERYVVPTTIQSGVGYWVLVSTAANLSIPGTAPSSYQVQLAAGWNLVAPAVAEPVPTGTGLVAIYSWNGTSYAIPTQCVPGQAYRVYSTQTTTIW